MRLRSPLLVKVGESVGEARSGGPETGELEGLNSLRDDGYEKHDDWGNCGCACSRFPEHPPRHAI